MSHPIVWSKFLIPEVLPDRLAMSGRAGTGKQPSSCSWLELSKAGKDHELAAEGQKCFLKEVHKDKRDGANLSG